MIICSIKSHIPQVLLILLLTACVKTPKEEMTIDPEPISEHATPDDHPVNMSQLASDSTEIVFIDSADFVFYELEAFDLRGWYQGRFQTELKAPSRAQLKAYFQSESSETAYLNNFRLFSVQRNTNQEKIITIIEGDESCCSDLHHLVYDDQNRLLSDNIVAGTGGDGMWSFTNFGRFINDSTYLSTRVDNEEIDLNGGQSVVKMDSVVTHYRYYRNRPFKIIKQEKFEKSED